MLYNYTINIFKMYIYVLLTLTKGEDLNMSHLFMLLIKYCLDEKISRIFNLLNPGVYVHFTQRYFQQIFFIFHLLLRLNHQNPELICKLILHRSLSNRFCINYHLLFRHSHQNFEFAFKYFQLTGFLNQFGHLRCRLIL